MSLTMKGKVSLILPVEEGISKAGKEWQKQSFVIDTGDQYNPELCFQVFGTDKIEKVINAINVGQQVEVHFNVSSREWEGKYFHNIDAWKVEVLGSAVATPTQAPTAAPSQDANGPVKDDLPF